MAWNQSVLDVHAEIGGFTPEGKQPEYFIFQSIVFLKRGYSFQRNIFNITNFKPIVDVPSNECSIVFLAV